MRIVFAGSPEVALPVLRALVESAHEVVGVVSQPDRPVGRKQALTPTAVTQCAREWGLAVATPQPSEDLASVIARFQPELAIAVAYGRLVDARALEIPTYGWWNLHFSVLPAWRGAAPVQRALIAGAQTTGISVFQMDQGLDTGPLLLTSEYAVRRGITAGELMHELAEFGAQRMLEALSLLEKGMLISKAQTGTASLAPKVMREEGWLRCGESAALVFRRFQGCTPEPGAFFRMRGSGLALAVRGARQFDRPSPVRAGELAEIDGEVVVGCQEGAVVLERVVSPGSREMGASDWRRGAGRGVSFEL